MNSLIYSTIIAIFFPVYIQFQGRDATTTGNIAIVCLFFAYISSSFCTKNIQCKFWFLVLSLAFIGMVSSSFLPHELTMKSIRHLGAFICSMLLFFVVVNRYLQMDAPEQKEGIERLISFVLLMGAIQIGIGILLYFYPPIGKLLAVFAPRDVAVLVTVDAGGKRLQSIMTGWEEMGEFIAVLAPLVFYRVAKTGGKVFSLLYLVLYFIGLILANTRSAIILFIMAALVFLIWNRHTLRFSKMLLGSYILGVCLSLLLLISPFVLKYWDTAMARFTVSVDVYTKTNSFLKAIDRAGTWNYGLKVVDEHLNLFGNGMVTPGNFHCLYLTALYTLGIVGATALFVFFAYLFVSLFLSARKAIDPDMKCLASACTISFGVFLVNEIKFEFTRDFSYQAFIWLLLALFWLVSHCARHYRPPVGREKATAV